MGEYLEAKYNLTTAYVTADPTGVRFSHSGSADPDTEGWLYGHRNNIWDDDPNCSDGPVTGDSGYDARNIDDGSTAGNTINYLFGGLTVEEREAAANNGWILRVRARVVEPQVLTSSSQSVTFESTHPSFLKRFTMYLGADAGNNAEVGLYDGTFSNPPLEWNFEHVYHVGSDGYHLYELRYKPAIGKAELYVDGGDTGIEYSGYENTTGLNRILWGSNASVATGNVNYNVVEFEILPETPPGTIFVLR